MFNRSYVTQFDIEQNAAPTDVQDFPDIDTWTSLHGISKVEVEKQFFPDNTKAEKTRARDLRLRAQAGISTGNNDFGGEFQIKTYSPEERNKILVMSIAGGLVAVLIYSFFTRKPLLG